MMPLSLEGSVRYGSARLPTGGALCRFLDIKIAGVEIISVVVLGVLPFVLGVLVGTTRRSEPSHGVWWAGST